MALLIGLCGFLSTRRDEVAAALAPDFKRSSFMDAARGDLSPVFKRMPPHQPGDEVRLTLEYRRTCLALDPAFFQKRLRLTDSPTVFHDIHDRDEARFVLDKGGLLFRIHRAGAMPVNADESRAADAVHAAFAMPQIWADDPQTAANEIRAWLKEHGR